MAAKEADDAIDDANYVNAKYSQFVLRSCKLLYALLLASELRHNIQKLVVDVRLIREPLFHHV